MRQVLINLYSFSELSKEAKNKAIEDHSIFLNEVDPQGRNYSKRETVESIEINEYLFFPNGELAHITEYTGKHPKAGKIEFHLEGITYDITQ